MLFRSRFSNAFRVLCSGPRSALATERVRGPTIGPVRTVQNGPRWAADSTDRATLRSAATGRDGKKKSRCGCGCGCDCNRFRSSVHIDCSVQHLTCWSRSFLRPALLARCGTRVRGGPAGGHWVGDWVKSRAPSQSRASPGPRARALIINASARARNY